MLLLQMKSKGLKKFHHFSRSISHRRTGSQTAKINKNRVMGYRNPLVKRNKLRAGSMMTPRELNRKYNFISQQIFIHFYSSG